MKPLLAGTVLAFVTVGVASLLPSEPALGLLAAILGLAVGAYLGSSTLAGEPSGWWTELLATPAFLGLIVAGFWAGPEYLAAGWALHVGWDWLHHTRRIPSGIAGWVPPFCAVYDLLIAAYIVVRWL